MKKKMIAILLITLIIGSSVFFIYNEKHESPEELALIFLEQLLTATPYTQSEIFDINMFSQNDILSYIEINYSDMATERMMKNLYMNRYILLASDVALDSNSNVSLNDFKIILTQHSDEKVYFNFEGTTKVTSLDTGEEIIFPFTGQVGLTINDESPKVDTLRFFTITMLDHGIKAFE